MKNVYYSEDTLIGVLLDYNTGTWTENSKNVIQKLKKDLFRVYPKLRRDLDAMYAKAGYSLSAKEKDELESKVVFADYIHSFDFSEINDDAQMLKSIKNLMMRYFPVVLDNRGKFLSEHFQQCEPHVATMIFIAMKIMDNIDDLMQEEETQNIEDLLQSLDWCLRSDMVVVARSLRSSLMMFCIGDDVHGVALARGLMETATKTVLVEKKEFQEDYVRYKRLNALLQKYKMKEISFPKELTEFMKEKKISNGQLENHLLYGWIKDAKGRPITTMKSLFEMVFQGEKLKTVLEFYHYSSEMVHNDYVGVDYPWVELRRRFFIYYLTALTEFKKNICAYYPKKFFCIDGFNAFDALDERMKSLSQKTKGQS